jgi:hypothetical protein
LKNDALLKASGAMTGGIGGLADTCGSMIGATLVLGSVLGLGRRDGEEGMSKLWESIKQAADFYHWFKKINNTVNCREIITKHGNGTFYDYGDPEQAQAAMEAGVTDKCIELVENNCSRTVEILWDAMEKNPKL